MKTLHDFHARIAAVQQNATLPPMTVVFFGDSNTRGSAIDPDTHRHGLVERVLADLRDRYPPATFNGLNAGIPGDTMAGALNRVERDVLRHTPDLVVIAFGLNDASSGGLAGLNAFRANAQALLDIITPQALAIILTPNTVAMRENTRVPNQYRQHLPANIFMQTTGVLDIYVQVLRDISQSQAILLADPYQLWQALAGSGIDTTRLLANGSNHPMAYMHALGSATIMQALEPGV